MYELMAQNEIFINTLFINIFKNHFSFEFTENGGFCFKFLKHIKKPIQFINPIIFNR